MGSERKGRGGKRRGGNVEFRYLLFFSNLATDDDRKLLLAQWLSKLQNDSLNYINLANICKSLIPTRITIH